MTLLVGLGNPGESYARTRHNFGFTVADALAAAAGVSFRMQEKFNAEVAEWGSGDQKVIVAKPQTFMNLSGQAVAALARFYKIPVDHIWVIADDLDLPLGKIRVRQGGESGGHHGIDNIRDLLGANDFWRIRLGVRGEALRQVHLENKITGNQFVMANFEAKEAELVTRTIEAAASIVHEGLESHSLRAHTYEVSGIDEHPGAAST